MLWLCVLMHGLFTSYFSLGLAPGIPGSLCLQLAAPSSCSYPNTAPVSHSPAHPVPTGPTQPPWPRLHPPVSPGPPRHRGTVREEGRWRPRGPAPRGRPGLWPRNGGAARGRSPQGAAPRGLGPGGLHGAVPVPLPAQLGIARLLAEGVLSPAAHTVNRDNKQHLSQHTQGTALILGLHRDTEPWMVTLWMQPSCRFPVH